MTGEIDTYGYYDTQNSRLDLLTSEHDLPHYLGNTQWAADHCYYFRHSKNYNNTGFFGPPRVYFLSNVAL
jgi:hypothetical protein